jgi:hypothetical protein
MGRYLAVPPHDPKNPEAQGQSEQLGLVHVLVGELVVGGVELLV